MVNHVEGSRGQAWLRGAALALIAFAFAGCSSDATRFSDSSNPFASRNTRPADASVPPPIGRVENRPIAQAALPPPNKPTGVAASATAHSAAKHVHVVARGDTLMKLSRRYGKSLTEIAKANNISASSKLRIGDRIKVPGAAPSATVAVAPASEPPPAKQKVADARPADPSHTATARIVTPAPVPVEGAAKSAEPAGGLPSFRWPVRGRIIAGFGPKTNGQQNDGINLAVPEGTPIKAAEDGVVAYAGNELKGYGNLVLIRHGNGYVTAYAHASEVVVKRGDQIKRGQVIARSGQTGNVTSPQLHFEIRKGATPVDPMQFLNGG
jgi:murein DD-endopeptidase MepM/ murein hydrolase activator NlpD